MLDCTAQPVLQAALGPAPGRPAAPRSEPRWRAPPPATPRWRPAARLAVRVDGRPAAATTVYRKRAVFYNALGLAVERRLLPANPIDQVQWTAPEVAQAVDRRVVASLGQVRALLDAVRLVGRRGDHPGGAFRLSPLRRHAAGRGGRAACRSVPLACRGLGPAWSLPSPSLSPGQRGPTTVGPGAPGVEAPGGGGYTAGPDPA
jgi:hypothetical protein